MGVVRVRHAEEEDVLHSFTLNPAEPSTVVMPLTETRWYYNTVHVLAS